MRGIGVIRSRASEGEVEVGIVAGAEGEVECDVQGEIGPAHHSPPHSPPHSPLHSSPLPTTVRLFTLTMKGMVARPTAVGTAVHGPSVKPSDSNIVTVTATS